MGHAKSNGRAPPESAFSGPPGAERKPAYPPGAVLSRRAIPYILITLALFALLGAVRANAPAKGEELGLRWLRTAADHPLRTLSALLLAVYGLSPRRSPP